MTITPVRIDEIKQRAAAERDRRQYPAEFPRLPPVPAGRYRAIGRFLGEVECGLLERHGDVRPAP